MRKLLIGAGLALVLVVAGVWLFVNELLGTAIERGARYALGVDVRVGFVRLALLSADFRMNGFQVANPPGFEHGRAHQHRHEGDPRLDRPLRRQPAGRDAGPAALRSRGLSRVSGVVVKGVGGSAVEKAGEVIGGPVGDAVRGVGGSAVGGVGEAAADEAGKALGRLFGGGSAGDDPK